MKVTDEKVSKGMKLYLYIFIKVKKLLNFIVVI